MPPLRRNRARLAPLIALLSLAGTSIPAGAEEQAAQAEQIQQFVLELADKHGFEPGELTVLLRGAKLVPRILEAIASPAEAKPWYAYRPIFVTRSRIEEGVRFWDRNAALLEKAEQAFGVPPEIIVAILGVETRYGRHRGGFRVLDSLATLAFNYPPRSAFFRRELEQFLLLAREENLDPLEPVGSYAGAMGRPQFISSSYRAYAIDFDGDGFRDLWGNDADAIGSIANYFVRHGWQPGDPITYQASIDAAKVDAVLSGSPKPTRTVGELRRNGVQFDAELDDTAAATLFRLETRGEPEHWIGLQNFYVITRYNHSILYAMAVYQLSREILGRRGQLQTAQPGGGDR